ncbi:phosphatase PAP2 family protein [uncultured Rubinisphaera sp.]|uniref:phosphatase PAP2 family protein n=1 Tax=uncultured Rubinisphaera sp. TaxID=1678686 RepID=UPI0030D8A449
MNTEFLRTYGRASRVIHARFPIIIPMIALLIVTGLLELTGLDLAISSLFYDVQTESWPLSDAEPWQTIDEYFVFPGVILGGIATISGLIACIRWQWNDRARAAVLLTWVLIIGPGLLVNASLKPFFSRPRPREVTELGGPKMYQPAFGFGDQVHHNSSFPSGHASIGFFLIAPAFACRKRAWRIGLLSSGLCYGSLMSISRIVQGGHYLSDTIWSLGILYATCWALATLILAVQYQRIRLFVPAVSEDKPQRLRNAA